MVAIRLWMIVAYLVGNLVGNLMGNLIGNLEGTDLVKDVVDNRKKTGTQPCQHASISRRGDLRSQRSWCRLRGLTLSSQTTPRSLSKTITTPRYGPFLTDVISGNQRAVSGHPAFHQRSTSGPPAFHQRARSPKSPTYPTVCSQLGI